MKTISGTPLIIQRIKSIAVRFITATSSTKMLALDLMENNDSSLILSYKYLEDLLRVAVCMYERKKWFNNNQNLRTFKAALKGALIRISIIASKHVNCILFEEQASNSIFFPELDKELYILH